MSSFRRIISSQTNGALSQGPVSEEGKRHSSVNALRHGLLSKSVVLQNESEEMFQELLQQHIDEFTPPGSELSGVQMGMVEDLTASYWRMRRLLAIETRMLDDEISGQNTPDELARVAHAFSNLSDTNKFNLLSRYQGRLQRAYHRTWRDLQHCQHKKIPNEPSL